MSFGKRMKDHFRILVQCISFVFHNGYVRGWAEGKIYTGSAKQFCVPGLNCYSCPGAFGACPIGSLQAVLDSGEYKFSLYVLGFIGAVGVFCGRFVCGWLCPFGLIQDLLYKIPFIKKVKNLPFHKQLKNLRFVILAVFVILLPMLVLNRSGVGQPWFCEYICPSGTLLGGYPLIIANESLKANIGIRFIWKTLILAAVLLLSVISFRPFCKYVCPLGALYGLANPISIYRFKVEKDSCIACGKCQRVCGMDIKVWEQPNSMDCIRCGKCINACPTASLSTSFSKSMKMEKAQEEGIENDLAHASHIKLNIAAVLCICTAAVMLFNSIRYVVDVTRYGGVSDVMSLCQYCAGDLILMVPLIMTLLFGCSIIRSCRKTAEIQEAYSWPARLIKLTLMCVIATYLAYLVLLGMYGVELDAEFFALPIYLGIKALLRAIGLLIVLLIVKVILRENAERILTVNV